FGGTDFEVAIHRNRIATDNLAGESLGERDSESGLAGSRRSEDDDEQRISGAGRLCRHSPRAPGNGLAEAHKSNEQNHKRQHQETRQLKALARFLALVPLRGSGLLLAGYRRFRGHSAILRAAVTAYPLWRGCSRSGSATAGTVREIRRAGEQTDSMR